MPRKPPEIVPEWLKAARREAKLTGYSVTVCLDPNESKKREREAAKVEKRKGNYSKWGKR